MYGCATIVKKVVREIFLIPGSLDRSDQRVLPSLLNVALIRKICGSLMCLAYYFLTCCIVTPACGKGFTSCPISQPTVKSTNYWRALPLEALRCFNFYITHSFDTDFIQYACELFQNILSLKI